MGPAPQPDPGDGPASGPPRRPVRPQLTLRQMAELVVFAAVASACLAPALRLAEMKAVAWGHLVLAEAVGLPLALAMTAMALPRRGPLKDWATLTLLTPSVAVVFGFAVYHLGRWIRDALALVAWGRFPAELALLVAVVSLSASAVGLALAFLLRRVLPRRCPRCRGRWLLWERAPERGSGGGPIFRCLGCGGRFRTGGGDRSWRAVPEPRSGPVPADDRS